MSMPETTFDLGLRVRTLRKERGLSQRELADSAGLSPNAISLIERNEISPSVATLQRLAGAFDVRMSYFFVTEAPTRVLHFRAGQHHALHAAGLTLEGLGGHLVDQHMEPFFITLASGADMGAGYVTHEGHEFVYCVAGRLCYEIDDKEYRLEPGEALLFEATLPHRWGNGWQQETRALLVLHAPHDPDEPTRRHFPAYPSVTHLG